MPKNVRCNIEDHRLLIDGQKVEDVTTITPPNIEHPTVAVKAAGMVMDVDMPNMYHYNAMELTIAHNNGNNCDLLIAPGTHSIELRAARQNYDVAGVLLGLELVKMRAVVVHKTTEKGTIEAGNPYGSTERYSVVRYEEEQGGEVIELIDSMAGIIRIKGQDYSSELSSMLD